MNPGPTPEAERRAVERLLARHGEGQGERIRRGVEQAARRWWPEDGDDEAFVAFAEASFLVDAAELDSACHRLEAVLEQALGHLHEVRRAITEPLDTDTGPISRLDRMLVDLDLAPHVDEDLFRVKVAFFALLNFPVHTLRERLEEGPSWDREAWARSRMMDRFAVRVPARIQQEFTRAATLAEQYISDYNIRLDRLVTAEGERPFPEGLSVISHWGLRDELASHYADDDPAAGLARQRLIQTVMERIIRQEIPAAVIDNPDLLWDPVSGSVRPAPGSTAEPLAAREPDTRYARLLDVLHAVRRVDPFSPTAPTFRRRRFERDREMPEPEVEALLESVLTSGEAAGTARLIRRRLGRPLEPFDLWYSGFKARGAYTDEELDRIVRERYPSLEAFAAGLPRLLENLGFAPEKARWVAERIAVDPARGAGHAVPAVRREDRSHLRTRVPRGGMSYKGYNVALHELGHNVEQVFSLAGIDHWWLAGVPNNAITEAFAFVFQERDLEMLGLDAAGEGARHRRALATLWNTYEIAGVSLVDMKVWEWLYEHPEASPAELREAVRSIARGVWNRYFAPAFGQRDSELLAIYSHMIAYGLYLPDYALGHMAAFQVSDHLRGRDFGTEVERMARQGRLTPDAWMRGAVGAPLSAEALLRTAGEALAAEEGLD